MEQKIASLEALLKDEKRAVEIFSGTDEEVIAKLADVGVEMTAEDFAEFKIGVREVLEGADELSEESLEDVSGGCKTCNSFGRTLGKGLGNLVKKIKAIWDFFN